jgi:hypothetical protein
MKVLADTIDMNCHFFNCLGSIGKISCNKHRIKIIDLNHVNSIRQYASKYGAICFLYFALSYYSQEEHNRTLNQRQYISLKKIRHMIRSTLTSTNMQETSEYRCKEIN